MSTLRMVNLQKRYDNGFEAVPGLDLEIHDGEFLVLVGPSGCGKSTVLRMVAGLEDISGGELLIDEAVVNTMGPQQRDIAMVFQSYALYPNMTVADNIAFAMKLRKTDKAEIAAKVAEVAELLELTAVLDRKPGQLSGGQRQRVAMGRAIVRNPKLFLMDEPLSNLDAKLRVQTRAEISKLQRRLGVTTMYVTHDQIEAMTMGDRVAVLRRGVLMQCASPAELYETPDNLFVAQFIGSPSMNVVRGKVVAADADSITLSVGSQSLSLTGESAARLAGLR
ncbi:MAG: ATP-binding cassette domain-containing protein, partial [Actinomycetota bacterium]|nr:ATP-binding cassette domain-containing protein [Actinomycetota bacterium]